MGKIQEVIKEFKKQNTKVVFEIGSRDAKDAVKINEAIPDTTIYAFECNKKTIGKCRENIKNHPKINVVERCVFDYDGYIVFHPIDAEKTETTWEDGNPGASSVFVANGKYSLEKYVQSSDVVQCVRLDTWMREKGIERVDAIWMDLQGSELQALVGLGDKINDVRVVFTEVEFEPIYEGQSLFPEINSYLISHGFKEIFRKRASSFSADILYTRGVE